MTLESFKAKIDQTLSDLILTSSDFPSLYEGAKYALLAPGKRVRPLLTLSVSSMLKADVLEAALLPACALEMVHTYSLIHDDLPCMDDDDFRRGLPTLHRVYSEGHAVLIGDYLLTYAFETLCKTPLLSPEQKLKLTQILAKAAGGEGMIGGQVMDIENSTNIDRMHSLKTAALFCAAVEFGGVIAQAPSSTLYLLRSFGLEFGKLFQYIDDLLDDDHPLGLQKAERAADFHYQNCLSILNELSGDTSNLRKLTDTLYQTKCLTNG